MKTSDLRVGNYIMVNGEIQQVSELPLPENCTSENTESIPITEQWLLDFGFKRDGFGVSLNNIHLEASSRIVKTDKLCGFTWQINPDVEYVRIEFVHTLQNLYYAICGEELKLKEDEK